jgi:DNA repair exonuclease SbcCD nuclease subunit
MFGHFVLPLFYMNAMVQMPDHGELQANHFKHQDYVFSGHFHKRQARDKIVYIGNAFPHNFSDTWDDDRGMMFMEWDGTPEYLAWPDAPKFRSVKLSRLIDEQDTLLKDKMYLKVHLDIDISFEEANFLKETFMASKDIRELQLIQERENLEGVVEDAVDSKFESVDQIVTEQLVNIDSEAFDKKLLLEIYHNL